MRPLGVQVFVDGGFEPCTGSSSIGMLLRVFSCDLFQQWYGKELGHVYNLCDNGVHSDSLEAEPTGLNVAMRLVSALVH